MGKQLVNTGKGNQTINNNNVWDRIVKIEDDIKDVPSNEEFQLLSAQMAHITTEKVDQVVLDGSTMKFYANGTQVYSISIAEAGNTTAVQSYIDTLVANGQIEGVTLADNSVKLWNVDGNFSETVETSVQYTLNTTGFVSNSSGILSKISSSTRYHVILDVNILGDSIEFYFEGSSGTANFASSSNKILLLTGNVVGTSQVVKPLTLLEIPNSAYISEYSNTEKYAKLNKTSLPANVTHIAINFDATVPHYVKTVALMQKKSLDWLAVSETNLNEHLKEKINMSKKQDFRILLISDLHFKKWDEAEGTGGLSSKARFEFAVQCINEEHARKKIDFVLIVGDLLDNDATYPTTDFLPELKTDVLSKITVPYFCIHGSHETQTETKWRNLFGYSKNYTIDFNDYALICIDSYGASNNFITGSGFGYTPVDVVWAEEQLEKYKSKKGVFIIAHWLETNQESAFLSLLNNYPNVICGFEGHIHSERIYRKGNFDFYQTGHFAIAEGGSWNADVPWSYKMLEQTSGQLKTYTVHPEHTYPSGYQPYQQLTPVVFSQTFDTTDIILK